ncbi:transcription factor [Blumeria hordei DH14]|uniref:Transcription factor n=1 Tax=Blumeria graminis f. sp. hordei (strain DH14) TaxID=546991 RepID=N1JIG0_BLUG1|nr:transcription factor [Blumeria hordei DH14]
MMLKDTGIHKDSERKKKLKRLKKSRKHVSSASIISHQTPLAESDISKRVNDGGEAEASEKDYEHQILQPPLKSDHVNLNQDNQKANLERKYSRKKTLSAGSNLNSTGKRKSRDANQDCTIEILRTSSPKLDKSHSILGTRFIPKKDELDKREISHQESATLELGPSGKTRDMKNPEEPDSDGIQHNRTLNFLKERLETDNLRDVARKRKGVVPVAIRSDHRKSKKDQNPQKSLIQPPPRKRSPAIEQKIRSSQNLNVSFTELDTSFEPKDTQVTNYLEANSELSVNPSSVGEKPKLRSAVVPLKRKRTKSVERLTTTKDKIPSSVSKKIRQTSENNILKDPIVPEPDKNSFTPAIPKVKNSQVSVEELSQISNAIDSFRRENNMTQYAVNDLIHKEAKKTDQAKQLWLRVSERVPTIPKQKLINLCRRKFHNYDARGAWTAAQDEDLKALYDQYPNKWTTIGQIINRFPEDCRDRWRNYLVCGDNMRSVTWEFEEEQRLRCAVGEFLKKYHEEHSVADIDDSLSIDWQTISRMMGHSRSRLQCSLKWKALKDRCDSGDDDDSGDASKTKPLSRTPWRLEDAKEKVRVMCAEQKLQLLYAIKVCGSKRESKIPWVQIEKLNPGISGNKLALRLIFKRLKDQVPQHEEKKIPEIVQYLIDAYEAASPNEPEGFNELEPSTGKYRRASLKIRKKKKHKSALTVDESDLSEDLDTQISPQTNSKHCSIAITEGGSEKMRPSPKAHEASSIQDKECKSHKESLQSNQSCTLASDSIFPEGDQVAKKRTKPRRTYGRTCKPPLVRAQRSHAPMP